MSCLCNSGIRVNMLKRIRSKLNRLRYIVNSKDIRNTQLRLLADQYRNELIIKATSAELKFIGILDKLQIDIEFQYVVFIESNNRIKRFYIVDFCDLKNKYVFEIDGEYHQSKQQQEKDRARTKNLNKLGYKVYRFTNEQVFKGVPVSFLKQLYYDQR